MNEIDDKTYAEIQDLCDKGDDFADNGDYHNALAHFWQAFDLVPEPKTDWDTATWILAAIGDTNFLDKDFQAGVEHLSQAMHCPDAIGNPFIHMRLGQCQLEIGNLDRATDELLRAFALEGDDIFAEEDPKYLAFLKARVDI
ncbi:tetratricopeptide repeat protein [Suttonella sp. R2A3]|uniref:tetratricopeptide repeat protein n=1 Tax=Suttonella sp. R2A3 TaxID=2908648 RepID=UPI001F2CDF0E|nr:tetratricopeptide repeat protein [Suttonella sp. R2A3]UJF25222.1 tetratricopeptide repeat protein [Suttonella sp. R2A3]